ncbi:papilin-like [Erythrolamprus reginae]|uniref:papilin-like n=1 Tax=Erythrolamprus reginae TaxID=121349 RepID=UPI00396CEF5D
MKGHLVCFLLLAVTFAAATEWDGDSIRPRVKGGQVQQQTPEPPTIGPPGTKQQGKPGPPRYGECPPTTTLLYPQVLYCQVDRPCPGDEKCCQIGNIRKCVLPKGVHHGYCPRPQDQAIYKKPCTEDHQCGWHEKCCRTEGHKKCVEAVPAVRGLCPKRRLPEDITPCEGECVNDSGCNDGKKCCYYNCGLKCVEPERPQEQDQEQEQEQEQDQKKGKGGGEAGKGRCRADHDCLHGKKCCKGVCRRECQAQDLCHLPKRGGLCMAFMPRWFYNWHTGACEHFIYGGCGGNANNFNTLKECELRCVLPDTNRPGTCPTGEPREGSPCGKFCSNDASCPNVQRCCATPCGGQECRIPQEYLPGYCPMVLLPPSTGDVCFPNCTNDWDCNRGIYLPRKKCCVFGDRKICVEAVEEHPGVCPARVEVQLFAQCNNTCTGDHDCPLTEKCCFTGCSRGCLPSVRSERCQRPPQEESCKGALPRYHYDPDKKRCVSYQSCKDYPNNFKTKELCEKACGKISKEVCKLPADPGRCQGYSRQYYFNWNTKRCEIFNYGLCGGNDNRFATRLECEMVCGEFEQQQQQQQQRPKE